MIVNYFYTNSLSVTEKSTTFAHQTKIQYAIDIFMLQSIIMEIYFVLAVTFLLGATFAFFCTKSSYEKQIQKTKVEADKKLEDMWVEKTIAEHRIILMNQERNSTTAVNY